MKIHALINYSLVDLGSISTWAENKGHSITTTIVNEDTRFPSMEEFDLLIVLGGIMSAYEEDKYPWIKKEKQFIKEAIDANKGVLGICLGAQMIAESIGGKAFPQENLELGWWEVEFTEEIKDMAAFKNLPTTIKLFQFHRDTYQLPPQATWLAKSKGCPQQAFIYEDRVVGLQFHPEFTDKKLHELVNKLSDEMILDSPYAQKPEEFLGKKAYVEEATKFLFTLLDNLEEIVA